MAGLLSTLSHLSEEHGTSIRLIGAGVLAGLGTAALLQSLVGAQDKRGPLEEMHIDVREHVNQTKAHGAWAESTPKPGARGRSHEAMAPVPIPGSPAHHKSAPRGAKDSATLLSPIMSSAVGYGTCARVLGQGHRWSRGLCRRWSHHHFVYFPAHSGQNSFGELRTTTGQAAVAYVAYAYSDLSFVYPMGAAQGFFGEEALAWASMGVHNAYGQPTMVKELETRSGAGGAVIGALQSGVEGVTVLATSDAIKLAVSEKRVCVHEGKERVRRVWHFARRLCA